LSEGFPLGKYGPVMLIDGQLGREPESASEGPIDLAVMSHQQCCPRIVSLRDQLTGAVQEGLPGHAKRSLLAVDPCSVAATPFGPYHDPNAGRLIRWANRRTRLDWFCLSHLFVHKNCDGAKMPIRLALRT
jgi:hypothetical protein